MSDCYAGEMRVRNIISGYCSLLKRYRILAPYVEEYLGWDIMGTVHCAVRSVLEKQLM